MQLFGISPNDIEKIDYDIIIDLAKRERVVGIGEIGVDYYWNKENREEQKDNQR